MVASSYVSLTSLPVSYVAVAMMVSVFFVLPPVRYLLQKRDSEIPETMTNFKILAFISGLASVIIILVCFDPSKVKVPSLNQEVDIPVGIVAAVLFPVFASLLYVSLEEVDSIVLHQGIQTYSHGRVATITILVYILCTEPTFFAFWKAGAKEYPLNLHQFNSCVLIAIFSYIAEWAQNIAVTTEERASSVLVGFFTLPFTICLLHDVSVFKLSLDVLQIIGICILVVTSITYTIYEYSQRDKLFLSENLDIESSIKATRFSLRISQFQQNLISRKSPEKGKYSLNDGIKPEIVGDSV